MISIVVPRPISESMKMSPRACVTVATGLTAGVTYDFTVTATSGTQSGEPSAVSNSVTPSLDSATPPSERHPNIPTHSFVSVPYASGRLVVRKGNSVSQSLR